MMSSTVLRRQRFICRATSSIRRNPKILIGKLAVQSRCFVSKSESDTSKYIDEMIEMYSQPEINMTDLMIGRHVQSNPSLHYVEDEDFRTYTHAECERYSSQLAALLHNQGLQKGDRVAVMLPKSPQLIFAALGLWRLGFVFVPLFAAFERDAIKVRLKDSQAKVVITDIVNRKKFDFTTSEEGIDVRFLTTIIDSKLDTTAAHGSMIADTDVVYSLTNFEAEASPKALSPVTISPQDTICLLYTSGTTGLPKGVTIPASSLASFHTYMELGLGLESTLRKSHLPQRYLSIADPAWAYGLYYNLIGPLLTGIPPTYLAGGFDPSKLLTVLANSRITHFAAAPSAYRALCAYDQQSDDTSDKKDMLNQIKDHLVCASSAGEPLNPEIIDWWRSRMNGRSIADHYGQSETGMTVNWHWVDGMSAPVGPDGRTEEWTLKGSMGTGMPGFRMVCLRHSDGVVDAEVKDEPGELAVDIAASPLMWFQGYLNNPQRTNEATSACRKYYLTGDTVVHKDEGDVSGDIFWFSTRKDDVIKSSGYRIGPFDVENSVIADPRVAEVAVVGVPDKEGLRGEVVAAFVVLHKDHNNLDQKELNVVIDELQQLVRVNLSKHCYPRIVHFLDELPKTPSGKVQRFKLKQLIQLK